MQSAQNGSVDLDGSLSQQTTPKQRTVAFGKGFSHYNYSSSSYSTPAIHNSGTTASSAVVGTGYPSNSMTAADALSLMSMELAARKGSANSASNIYHHQLILGQPGQLKGFEKQRGYSVPNLGAQNNFLL